MKYYKLMKDNAIVGAVSSDNFVRYSRITRSFKRADENTGEYISYQGQIYRTPWMRPIVKQMDYISVLALEISEEEYNIYKAAIDNNEEIIEEPDEEIPTPVNPYVDPIEIGSVAFIRDAKIKEMSAACRQAIEDGFDLELRGETQHFSLSTQDQLNLMSINTTLQNQDLIPYHADGELCVFYTVTEMREIIQAMNNHKTYHIAYYNALKEYLNALEVFEEIAAITYGTPIPEEYKSDVLRVLE